MSMSKGGSVPASVELGKSDGERQDRRRHREARNAVCSRRRTWRPNFRECLARLSPGQKAGFEREIGLGGFEHLAVPSSPSRQRRGLSSCGRVVAREPCRPAELVDERVERAVLVIGRAEIAQAEVRLGVEALRQCRGHARLADSGFTGDQLGSHAPSAMPKKAKKQIIPAITRPGYSRQRRAGRSWGASNGRSAMG
jgi:hypothetical protein